MVGSENSDIPRVREKREEWQDGALFRLGEDGLSRLEVEDKAAEAGAAEEDDKTTEGGRARMAGVESITEDGKEVVAVAVVVALVEVVLVVEVKVVAVAVMDEEGEKETMLDGAVMITGVKEGDEGEEKEAAED